MNSDVVGYSDRLVSMIEGRTARVGVIGLGYVGLPFLVEMANVGFKSTGIDLSVSRVEAISRGENYIKDVDSDILKSLVKSELITATTDFDVIKDLDVIIICVPTPLDANLTPDLTHIKQATSEIAKRLRPGQLISLESTTYPGTTKEVLQPMLEASGLRSGVDFFLAYSPERVDPGNKKFNTKNTNKIVGGNDSESARVANAFYSTVIENVVAVSSATSAEMVKIYENTFRAVNIGLANEFAMLCSYMGLNVWEILDAAFTKPFGIMPFYPGPGVGGHCIAIDPHYMEWKAKEFDFQTQFISLAGIINRGMPHFTADRIQNILNDAGLPVNGSNILVVGVAYKPNVDDYRESPAIELMIELREMKAKVSYHDDHVPNIEFAGNVLSSAALTESTLDDADIVIIATNHRYIDYKFLVQHSRRVFDTRNATRGITADNINLL